MVYASLLTVVAACAVAAADRVCQELTIPVSVTARNGEFDITAPSNDIEVTNFVLNLAQAGHNYTADLLQNYVTVSGDYSIAATYCHPSSGPTEKLQILTHGVGFDRSYWDFSYEGTCYSYVRAALARGYSTFAFDRLGIGESSHGEPVGEIQAALEIAVLESFTRSLRSGTLPGISKRFDKIVHVGHSFGAIQTYGLTAMNPDISDAIVLQGFTQIPDYLPSFLVGANFVEARSQPALADYPAGYLASGDVSAVQTNFFAPGQFDPRVLAAAAASSKPVTVGELLTIGGPVSVPNSYEGPVLFVIGDRDLPFCGGNCSTSVPSLPAQSQQFFANASSFEAAIIPGGGHALNLEYSFPTTYAVMLDFLDENVA
jgi:pimeloyl-ACP methyl ester carboxylesterase